MSAAESPGVAFLQGLLQALDEPSAEAVSDEQARGRAQLREQAAGVLDGRVEDVVRLERDGVDVVGLFRLFVDFYVAPERIEGPRFVVRLPDGFPDDVRCIDAQEHVAALDDHAALTGRSVEDVEGMRAMAETMRGMAESLAGVTSVRIRGTSDDGAEIDEEVVPKSIVAIPVDVSMVEPEVGRTGKSGRPHDGIGVLLLVVRAHLGTVYPELTVADELRVLAHDLGLRMHWVTNSRRALWGRLDRLGDTGEAFVRRAREIAAAVPLEVGDRLGEQPAS